MKNAILILLLCPVVLFGGQLKQIRKESQAEYTSTTNLLEYHAVRSDRDGLALSVSQEKPKPMSPGEFDASINRMFDEAERWSAGQFRVDDKSSKQTVKILIHIHGGLNNWDDTINRMSLVPSIMSETKESDRYYPIFFSWPSEFMGSYGEHLVRIRQGNRVNVGFSIITTPFVLVTDLAKGLVNMPTAWGRQVANIKDRLIYNKSIENPKGWLSRNYKMAQYNVLHLGKGTSDNFDIITGSSTNAEGIVYERYVAGILTTPIKATLGTWGQGQMTADAWKVMTRRTQNVFYPPDQFEMLSGGKPGKQRLATHVSAGRFFELLVGRINEHTNLQYKVTFVGHSMGTMVLNHLFSTQRSALVDANAIDNIIYMGAACSVIDAIQTLDPLMESYGTNKPPQFYNLTLHPLAEMSEEMFPEKWPAGILPAGSLLHLIDTHLESPNTPLDRTLGSQVNVMSSIEAFNRIKANCHFKGFDFVPGVLPTRHGDFSKSPFWQEDFRSAKRFDQLPEHILKKMK